MPGDLRSPDVAGVARDSPLLLRSRDSLRSSAFGLRCLRRRASRSSRPLPMSHTEPVPGSKARRLFGRTLHWGRSPATAPWRDLPGEDLPKFSWWDWKGPTARPCPDDASTAARPKAERSAQRAAAGRVGGGFQAVRCPCHSTVSGCNTQ